MRKIPFISLLQCFFNPVLYNIITFYMLVLVDCVCLCSCHVFYFLGFRFQLGWSAIWTYSTDFFSLALSFFRKQRIFSRYFPFNIISVWICGGMNRKNGDLVFNVLSRLNCFQMQLNFECIVSMFISQKIFKFIAFEICTDNLKFR